MDDRAVTTGESVFESIETAGDEILVERACGGDTIAFEVLFRRHSPAVHAFLLRMCRNRSDAEDLTQEVFLKAWEHLAAFEGRSRLLTWLMGIAVGSYRTRTRAAIRRGHRQHAWYQQEIERAEGSESDAEELLDLERAIGRLPERARTVLILNRIHGRTLSEVAEILGISVGTCKAHIHRAKKLIRRELER